MQKTIFRSGKVSNKVSIKVDTVDGTANEGSDYRGIHEVFTMEPHQSELPIQVEIGEEFAEAELLSSTRAANNPLVFTITEKAPTRAFSWFSIQSTY